VSGLRSRGLGPWRSRSTSAHQPDSRTRKLRKPSSGTNNSRHLVSLLRPSELANIACSGRLLVRVSVVWLDGRLSHMHSQMRYSEVTTSAEQLRKTARPG